MNVFFFKYKNRICGIYRAIYFLNFKMAILLIIIIGKKIQQMPKIGFFFL